MALAKAGIRADVFEAYGRGADGVGAFLGLASNGLEALGTLGLHHLADCQGFETPRMRIAMANGRTLAEFPLGSDKANAPVPRTVSRSGLYEALRNEAERRGIPIRYGKKLVTAEPRAGAPGVVARFADGTTASADLLIGADGIQSSVREIIDQDAPRPRYVPLLNAGGYARGPRVDGEIGVMQMIFGRRCFFCYTPHPNGEVWWFANPPEPRERSRNELAAITAEQWKTRLIDLFADDLALAVDLIRATPAIAIGWNTYDVPHVPRWHRDRMVIIGDAAHATAPSAGQGASMAIEDAVVLAKCLRDVPDVDQAFGAYERSRRQRVERVVAQGRRNGQLKSLGLVTRLLLPIFFKLRRPDDLSWLYDYRVEWDEVVAA
jgi:FAD-dependent urate hydroxylase